MHALLEVPYISDLKNKIYKGNDSLMQKMIELTAFKHVKLRTEENVREFVKLFKFDLSIPLKSLLEILIDTVYFTLLSEEKNFYKSNGIVINKNTERSRNRLFSHFKYEASCISCKASQTQITPVMFIVLASGGPYTKHHLSANTETIFRDTIENYDLSCALCNSNSINIDKFLEFNPAEQVWMTPKSEDHPEKEVITINYIELIGNGNQSETKISFLIHGIISELQGAYTYVGPNIKTPRA